MSINSVLVTGANRGLGLEFAKQFLALSKPPRHLFLTCRNPDNADDLKNVVKANPNVHIVKLDVKDVGSFSRVRDQVAQIVEDDGLNLVINNAGVLFNDSLDKVTRESMMENFEVNAVSPLLFTKELLPLLKKAAAKVGGSALSCSRAGVVNITSKMGSVDDNTSGGYYPYRVSKAALNMITKSLSVDLKPYGILAFVVHPGWVLTDMGGKNALINTETSVKGMINTILNASDEHCGMFFNYDGKKIECTTETVPANIVESEECHFAVVSFSEEDDSLFVVPTTWLKLSSNGSTECQWPLQNADRAAKNMQIPKDSWKCIPARVVHFARSYDAAKEYLNRYQYSNGVDLYSSSDVESFLISHYSQLVKPEPPDIDSVDSIPDDSVVDSESCAGCRYLGVKVDRLEKTIEELKSLVELNNQLIRERLPPTTVDINSNSLPQMKTYEELISFENRLKDSEEFTKMVSICGILGGKDIMEATRRILGHLISHPLALQLSWVGGEQKKSFKAFQYIIRLIAVAVRQSSQISGVTQASVEDVIKRWFRCAADRQGGRNERLKNRHVNKL